MAPIALSPPASNPTATIAVSGTVGLIARGLDANSRYISGGSFRFSSASPAVATVDSITGVVTGVANGTANIRSKVMLNLWDLYHQHGIEMPYPQRDVTLRNPEALAEPLSTRQTQRVT